MKRKFVGLVITALFLMTSLGVAAQDDVQITFWTTENQPERVERQQNIIAAFEEANPGVTVNIVAMDENSMDQLMTINVASGTAPDIALHPLQLSAKWYDQGLLDGEFATQVIEALGPDTFAPGALELLQAPDGNYTAIPSDGWGQLLIYRQDLFDEAGLEPPTSYETIMAAAEALHDPDNGFVGFLGGSSASQLYTWQVFEHIALANGASIVDAEGNVTAESEEMIGALEFYDELMTNYGPLEDDYFWRQTRAEYLAGNGAMVVWSPFILDEMAGLRDDAFPTCAECEDNPAYIAENSGVVSAISGPMGEQPAAWGSINSLGIAPDASPEAQAFVEFWMTEAYLDGLAIAPEGKFPMRTGTADDPDAFVEGWGALEVGVDRRAPLSDFYSNDTLATIVEGANNYTRMGFGQGQDVLASAVSTQFFIQDAIVAMLNDDFSPEEAAEEIQIAIEDLQFELEES